MTVGLWANLLQPVCGLACNLTSLHPLWQAPGSPQSDCTLSLWEAELHTSPHPEFDTQSSKSGIQATLPLTAIPVHQSVGSLDPVPFPWTSPPLHHWVEEWLFCGDRWKHNCVGPGMAVLLINAVGTCSPRFLLLCNAIICMGTNTPCALSSLSGHEF